LSVPVSLTAFDSVAVTGYLISESGIPPAATASGWTAAAPATFTFAGEGARTAYVWAKDAAGNVSATAKADVVIELPDVTAPAASIGSPADGATLTGMVQVSAIASDNKGVSKVEFFINGALKATASAAPYAFVWNTEEAANGSYALTVKAYDQAGNVGQSASVSVNVLNDTVAPVISVSAPTKDYLTSSKLTISASAKDNVAVVKMEAYMDNALVLSTSNSSFSVNTSVAKGVHTVTIKAYDTANNVAVFTKTVNRFF
jgi:hypothetical protein